MKKLFALIVVLALVNVASASFVDVVISSLNGTTIAPTKEITIGVSDTINMDIIYNNENNGMTLFGLSVDVYQTLISGTGSGTFDASSLTFPSGVWDMYHYPSGMSGWKINQDGSVGIWTSAAAEGLVSGGADVVAVDHLLFHCDGGLGDILIALRNDLGLPTGDTVERNSDGDLFPIGGFGTGVIVHQVPEPMTLTLLGLGSLFLARRKK